MKDEKITKTAYIANSGGLLGLCMGFSLVSAAEILYHCLFGLFSPICGRGKKNTKVRFKTVNENFLIQPCCERSPSVNFLTIPTLQVIRKDTGYS